MSNQANAEQSSVNVSEVLRRIRERVDARQKVNDKVGLQAIRMRTPDKPEPASAPLRDLRDLRFHTARARELEKIVGVANPRPAGLLNRGVQLAKKMMQRSLSWYTRPLKEFHGEVVSAISESTAALAELQHSVLELRTSLRGQTEARKLMEASLNWQVSNLSRKVDDVFRQSHEQLERKYEELSRRLDKIPAEWLAKIDSHVGPKASAHLWFNDAIVIQYDAVGRACWSATTERIIEQAWVLRNLSPDQRRLRILDIGCTESAVSLQLASNGFQVTGIDVRDYPLKHPNLQFVCADICDSPLSPDFYDLAIALSTVEHIGLGAYGDPENEASDRKAISEVFRFLKPGGRLLITVPFGQRAVTPLHRIYDKPALMALLDSFSILKLEFGVKLDEHTWLSPAPEKDALTRTHNPDTGSPGAVAMAICEKSRG